MKRIDKGVCTAMKRVIVESPYMAQKISLPKPFGFLNIFVNFFYQKWILRRNLKYARACLRDCLQRGEAPFASHLLYTQDGVLRDEVPEERKLGMEAGFVWGECAEKTVVYINLGLSSGMIKGMERAIKAKRLIEYRSLGPPWQTDAVCEIVQQY
ncbi:MAG: hypothetical protein Q7R73_01190 [bacterium]|nr:hypothetical protein [bacterium]